MALEIRASVVLHFCSDLGFTTFLLTFCSAVSGASNPMVAGPRLRSL